MLVLWSCVEVVVKCCGLLLWLWLKQELLMSQSGHSPHLLAIWECISSDMKALYSQRLGFGVFWDACRNCGLRAGAGRV